MAKDMADWQHHKGGFLTTLGFVILLIGVLRYYNVDSNIILMAVGLSLLLKGAWLKRMAK